MSGFDIRPPGAAPPSFRTPVHPTLWVLTGLMVAIHLAQLGASNGLLPAVFAPASVYGWLGFFTFYFDAAMDGQQVPLQFWWSFVTHAFVHGGWLHLGMNAAIFLAIGHGIVRASSIGVLLTVFFASAVGGAFLHGLISTHQGVLIGASGGIFGQLGLVMVWRGQMLRRYGYSLGPIWRMVLGLAVINVVLAFGLGGLSTETIGGDLAWEAHLGGFLTGAALGFLIRPRGA